MKLSQLFSLAILYMVYTVDISFDLRKHDSTEDLRRDVIIKAEVLNCDEVYWLYEIEGDTVIRRNHCVITASFNTISDIIKFIRFAKMKRVYNIETIVDENNRSKIIFASKFYLTKMSREKVEEYKLKRRENKWNESQRSIINSLTR